MKNRNAQNGFTLVELMIVVVLVSVLAAIALPAMSGNVRKTHRAIAKTILFQVQGKEEQFFLQNKMYTDVLSDLDNKYVSPLYINDNGKSVRPEEAIYKITVANTVDFTYKVIAEPVNSQMADIDCGNLILHSNGLKEVSGNRGVDTCW